MLTKVMCAVCAVCLISIGTQAALVGAWNFDEGSGTTAADSAGMGASAMGAVSGGYSWGAGVSGSCAVAAAGNNSYLSATYDRSLFGASPFGQAISIEAWIYPTAVSSEATIVAGTQTSSFLRLNPDGYGVGFGVITNDGWRDVNPWVTNTPFSYLNQWHRVIGTYDGQHVALYWDGQLLVNADFGSVKPFGTDWGYPLGNTLYIGATAFDPSYPGVRYTGSIDGVKLYNTAIPEPVSMLLLGAGALLGLKRRKA